MAREDPLLDWISSQLHPDGMPPPSRATTDYPGDNPRLTAFIRSKLYPAVAPQAQTTSPGPG